MDHDPDESVCLARRLAGTHLFFFNDAATTEIYTLSLHDALPISTTCGSGKRRSTCSSPRRLCRSPETRSRPGPRSEEHTSELQSHVNLVCRLLLEKKKLAKRQPQNCTRTLAPLISSARLCYGCKG